MEITYKDLQNAYDLALTGCGESSMMIIECSECHQQFTLIKGELNEVCSHLMDRIEKIEKKKETK